MNTTACKRLFSLGCVAHTDAAVLQGRIRPQDVVSLTLSSDRERSFGSGRELSVGPQVVLRSLAEADAVVAATSTEG